MSYAIYEEVVVDTDQFVAEGVVRGMLGYVIQIHPDGVLEVEISNPDSGETIALVLGSEKDFRLSKSE